MEDDAAVAGKIKERGKAGKICDELSLEEMVILSVLTSASICLVGDDFCVYCCVCIT